MWLVIMGFVSHLYENSRLCLHNLSDHSIKVCPIHLFHENYVDTLRDKAIISLFADSGMRLDELANIKEAHIDWDSHTITIWGKGNKQRKAPFTEKTAELLKQVIAQNGHGENIWHMKRRGIQNMLLELAKPMEI